MDGPDSSYSCFEIHICWKVEREPRWILRSRGVFPLWWCDDLDLHGGWGEGGDFLLHTVSDTGEHSGTTGEDGVGVQVLTDVNIALHDRVVGGLVDTGRLHTDEGGLEEGLGASESLVSNGDDLSIGQFVGFLQ